MKILILALMLCSLNAYAANIDLKITSKVKNKDSNKDFSSRVVAKLGQEFILPYEGSDTLKIKMTVSEFKSFPEAEAPIELMFSIVIIDTKDGDEKIISSPKIITLYDIEAKLSQGDEKSDKFFSMSILPSKNLK